MHDGRQREPAPIVIDRTATSLMKGCPVGLVAAGGSQRGLDELQNGPAGVSLGLDARPSTFEIPRVPALDHQRRRHLNRIQQSIAGAVDVVRCTLASPQGCVRHTPTSGKRDFNDITIHDMWHNTLCVSSREATSRIHTTRRKEKQSMSSLDGRVCVVTGAGRGLGREHALLLAAEGALVVVNDLGGAIDGSGSDAGPAQQVVDEIKAAGGEAIANTDTVTSWDGAKRIVQDAIDAYGRLDVLVNNAGILRDRSLVNLEEAEWDAVIDVHLKGHAAPTRWAAAHWRERSKAGENVNASVINTASGAMLGNAGQTNYSAAKAGIAAMTLVQSMELKRYGVRANCLAPLARTRLTLQTPGVGDAVAAPADGSFDLFDPGNVSPLVAYLATTSCPFTGGVFHVGGNEVGLYGGWSLNDDQVLATDGKFTVAELAERAPTLLADESRLASMVTSVGDTMAHFGRRAGG